MKYTAPLSSNGYASIDLAKVLAALLVLSIHTHPFASNTLADYYFTCLCRIGVPFFFVSGSYFFFSGKKKTLKTYVERLLKLYLIWFVLEIPITIQRFFIDSQSSLSFNLIFFIKSLLFNSTFFISWYITATIWATLIVSKLMILRKYRFLLLLCIICYGLALLNSMYSGVISENSFFNKIVGYINYAIVPVNSFIIGIPFVTIGYLIVDNKKKINSKYAVMGFVVSIILAFFEAYYCKSIHAKTDTYVCLIPLVFFLMCFLINVKCRVLGGYF